jgi:hypothetical protein
VQRKDDFHPLSPVKEFSLRKNVPCTKMFKNCQRKQLKISKYNAALDVVFEATSSACCAEKRSVNSHLDRSVKSLERSDPAC